MTCQCNCKNKNEMVASESAIPAGYRKVEPNETLENVGIIVGVLLFVVGILAAVFLGTAVRGSYYRRYW